MRNYKKKFQHHWMSTDHKPKGKMKREIEASNRMQAREEIRRELDAAVELGDNKEEVQEV